MAIILVLQSDTVPECFVNMKIMLKDFHIEINRDRLLRIRTISRIGPSLRIFKSVSMLNQSALCKFILNPNVKDYKIPKMTEMKLVIKVCTSIMCSKFKRVFLLFIYVCDKLLFLRDTKYKLV